MAETVKEILTRELLMRNDEVRDYQLNIDNYVRAIAKLDTEYAGREDLAEFRAQLETLLASSRLEQTKATIIRDVIAERLEEAEGSRCSTSSSTGMAQSSATPTR
jgi:hypothetical protein